MSLEKHHRSRSNITEKRGSQWEHLMRKFSQAHREECKAVSLDIPRVQRAVKAFPTGSSYEGTWDVLGMSGYGTYVFPNGEVFEGEFDDGTFHGRGELRYPSGDILRGRWDRGVCVQKTLIFADGLQYSDEDWKYLREDRRFTIEFEKGLQPANRSFLTADQPSPEIPAGFYDTCDGFYDPKTKLVYSDATLNTIVRSPSLREQKWIMENCRSSTIGPLGPRQELYGKWVEPQLFLEEPPEPSAPSRGAPTRFRRRTSVEHLESDHVCTEVHWQDAPTGNQKAKDMQDH